MPVLVPSCSVVLLCDVFWWPQIIKNCPKEHFVLWISWNVSRDFSFWEPVMYLLIIELRNGELPCTLLRRQKKTQQPGCSVELTLHVTLLLFCCLELCGWFYFYITLIQIELSWPLACSSAIRVTDWLTSFYLCERGQWSWPKPWFSPLQNGDNSNTVFPWK